MDKREDRYGEFWNYLSQPQKDLVLEGSYLTDEVVKHSSYQFTDYSFLVFPYAKAFEGYLKTVFRDVKFITHLDYVSDHLRLGKLLSPHMERRLMGRSLYRKLRDSVSQEFADRIWKAWKVGRNEIFHYFPHNVRSISFEEAQAIIKELVETMELVYKELNVRELMDKKVDERVVK